MCQSNSLKENIFLYIYEQLAQWLKAFIISHWIVHEWSSIQQQKDPTF